MRIFSFLIKSRVEAVDMSPLWHVIILMGYELWGLRSPIHGSNSIQSAPNVTNPQKITTNFMSYELRLAKAIYRQLFFCELRMNKWITHFYVDSLHNLFFRYAKHVLNLRAPLFYASLLEKYEVFFFLLASSS